jgi:hypothetical protein
MGDQLEELQLCAWLHDSVVMLPELSSMNPPLRLNVSSRIMQRGFRLHALAAWAVHLACHYQNS